MAIKPITHAITIRHVYNKSNTLSQLLIHQQIRHFSQHQPLRINPLLNLSQFSASKEAQFLSREKKIPREEFHPYLELIRSSEVDPFAPTPGAAPTVIAALKRAQAGQTDTNTAYTLALQNLLAQVQTARHEAVQAHAALARVHDKYRREERQMFAMVLAALAALGIVLVKTDALRELSDGAREVVSRWSGWDWEWLGNPPSHMERSKRGGGASGVDINSTVSSRLPMMPIEHQIDRQVGSTRTVTTTTNALPSTSRQKVEPESATASSSTSFFRTWHLPNLFWATPK